MRERAAYADMLHDTERNQMYYTGLRVAVKAMHARGLRANVLDIGTGTGLLSMMAAECGADSVTACEAFDPMADCAQKIMRDNKLADKIRLIPKRSTSIIVAPDGDMPQRANILVTEVFDTELIGEAALHTFTHAHQCLLEKDCIVIPMKATMYAQVVQSDLLRTWNWVDAINVPGGKHELHPPDDIRDCAGSISLHDIQLDQLDQDLFTSVAKPVEVFSFDFSGQSELPMTGHSKTHITSDITGRCDAVFMWWDLQMDLHNDVILSCAPRWAHPTPTDMQWRDHWMQAIYYPQRITKVNVGDTFVLHSCYDQFNLWFDVIVRNSNGYLSQPAQPLCTGGLHMSCSRGRLGTLQDQQRNSKMCALLQNKITEKSICLSVSDGSLLPLMAAKMGAKHVYTIEPEPMYRNMIEKFIETNGLHGKITVLHKYADQVTEDDLDGRKVDILIAEPHFYANSLPWHNVQFWYARTKLAPYLSDSVTITPQSATLYAVAVEFKDLWKIRAPVGDCEGFDLRSFDELILSASNEVDDKEEPHPLWEYPSSPLTKPVPLIKFDFTQPLIGMKTVQRQGIINFCSSGTCNGVALWMDFHVDSHNCVITGPTKPLKSGETIQWDMNSRQGVHLLQNQHTVEPGVGLDAQKFKYGVSFMPKTGDFEFKFAVG